MTWKAAAGILAFVAVISGAAAVFAVTWAQRHPGGQVVPGPTVTATRTIRTVAPPVTRTATATVTLPAVTRTVPGPAVTITRPGPTVTATRPGPAVTVTVTPAPAAGTPGF